MDIDIAHGVGAITVLVPRVGGKIDGQKDIKGFIGDAGFQGMCFPWDSRLNNASSDSYCVGQEKRPTETTTRQLAIAASGASGPELCLYNVTEDVACDKMGLLYPRSVTALHK